MNGVRSQPLHPAFLAQQLHEQANDALSSDNPDTPPVSLLGALKQQTAVHDTAIRASAPSGEQREKGEKGEKGDQAELHARQIERTVKQQLANSKLTAAMLVATLRYAPAHNVQNMQNGQKTTLDAILEKATQWVSEHEKQLIERISAHHPKLSAYHRFALRRLLVSVLQQAPEQMDTALPEPILHALVAPSTTAPVLATDPPSTQWQSEGQQADRSLAWARTMGYLLPVVQDCDFNRDLTVLLTDARSHLDNAVTRRAEALQTQLARECGPLDSGTQHSLHLHAIHTCGQVYAATLKRLYLDSTAMIAQCQQAQEAGDLSTAQQIADGYQRRQLGYHNLAHHFEHMLSIWQNATEPRPSDDRTAAVVSPAPSG